MSRFKVATKLGKYTFSLYCLHNIAVAISKKKKCFNSSLLFLGKLTIVSLIIVVIFSIINYHTFEILVSSIKTEVLDRLIFYSSFNFSFTYSGGKVGRPVFMSTKTKTEFPVVNNSLLWL
ncbi:hypothetical protein SAMN02745938_11615 [Flavobacterium psychrophilum DSM 3660]|nr:hypothetical protein SAMN02745938_11615 [Flavobacterium psychrophilum DSM 3660] [Flavobacterium psychrophilum DSM 3660 = ATCC 49418]